MCEALTHLLNKRILITLASGWVATLEFIIYKTNRSTETTGAKPALPGSVRTHSGLSPCDGNNAKIRIKLWIENKLYYSYISLIFVYNVHKHELFNINFIHSTPSGPLSPKPCDKSLDLRLYEWHDLNYSLKHDHAINKWLMGWYLERVLGPYIDFHIIGFRHAVHRCMQLHVAL